jgi:hypothetical protein
MLGAIRRFLQFISVAPRANEGVALVAQLPIGTAACLKGVATANAATDIAGFLADFHRGLLGPKLHSTTELAADRRYFAAALVIVQADLRMR